MSSFVMFRPPLKRYPHTMHLYRCTLLRLPSFFTMGELQAGHFLVHNAILDFQKGKDTEYQLEGHTISTRFDL